MNRIILLTLLNIATFALLCSGFARPLYADVFRIVSYNVENLFDLQADATDYPDYRPNGKTGWDRSVLSVKLKNIASVIKDMDAEIVALQEIESEKALALLQKQLSMMGTNYRYSAIAGQRPTSVKCAVLSTFPIVEKKDLVVGHKKERNILKITVEIADHPLIMYVNHWKSKSGPESKRIKYAKVLADEIAKQPCDADYILIGDFNADYNEYETFKDIPRFNDTRGITGINHVLHTIRDGRMVTESDLTHPKNCRYLYNLWLEVPSYRRWSVKFFRRKNSPDSIIVSKALYDAKGISYVDNSFNKFDPDYLFEDNKVFRWQRGDNGKGRHLGRGYSDHLPVFAGFSTEPFCLISQKQAIHAAPEIVNIEDLYRLNKGVVNVRIHNGTVIYKQGDNAVIKQKNGRAIYIYKTARELEYTMSYDLTITQLNRHYGNLEITGIRDVKPIGRATDIEDCFITGQNSNFSDPVFCNEVIDKVNGVYENKWFYYGKDRKIKIYFFDPALKPEKLSVIILSHVRIGFHRHPEIIVEKRDQIQKR